MNLNKKKNTKSIQKKETKFPFFTYKKHTNQIYMFEFEMKNSNLSIHIQNEHGSNISSIFVMYHKRYTHCKAIASL